MNYLDQAQVRKALEREFGLSLLAMLDAVAAQMGDQMAYNLALEIRKRLRARRTARVRLPMPALDNEH